MVDSFEGSLFGFKKPPILLMGSGISRRYAREAPNWRELLVRIAGRIGIDDIVPFENDAERKCREVGLDPRSHRYPVLATEMQKYLDEHLKSKEIRIDNILDQNELKAYCSRSAEAIKIMAAAECSRLRIDSDSPLSEEIGYLHRLPDIVPCVITTNYDHIIEDGLFDNRFKVYSRVSDYYLSGSQGIGEIFKIHGTCEDPSSIVLTEEDYERFNKRASIVSAKILSILCDYPMIILGYSIEDDDVKGILSDLMSSLDDDKLRELERNIVFIEYAPGVTGLEPSTWRIPFEEHVMTLRSFRTCDFAPIFREIVSMEASVSPSTIRKIRQVVRTVQITEKSNNERYKPIGIDDITERDTNKLVVVITDHDNMRVIESLPSMSTDSLMRTSLGLVKYNGDPADVVRQFISYGAQMYQKNSYVPIFHFMSLVDGYVDLDTPVLRRYVEDKGIQFRKKLKTISLPRGFSDRDLDSPDACARLIEGSSSYAKPLMVIYLFDHGRITSQQALDQLGRIYSHDSVAMKHTNMRMAVTYVGYKEFMDRESGSHTIASDRVVEIKKG